jgi:FkbM family methyltransferase
MKRTFRRLRSYYRMFGYRGLFFAARTELTRRPAEIEVRVPGATAPVALRLNTSDVDTYQQVFLDAEYAFDMCQPPELIVDAGANIGLASIYFATQYPKARIVAIEPEDSNFELLVRNTKPYPLIVPIQAALWRDDTPLSLIDPGLGKWGFQTRSKGAENGAPVVQRVAALTVDQVMRMQATDFIDILKMDIEGAEREVFQDASRWIDRVGVLIVELHERLRGGCNRRFYNATNGFELEWRRGENVYLAREGRCLDGSATVPQPPQAR